MKIQFLKKKKPWRKSTISINFVDHVLQLSLCGILSKRPHDSAQFLGSDGAIAILIEQRKGLFEFGNLLLRQLIRLQGQDNDFVQKM